MSEQCYDRERLEKAGYAIVNANLGGKDLADAQQAYEEIYEKAKSGDYKYYRVYDDYLGELNIAGIEMPLHPDIIDDRIVNILNQTDIIKIAKDYLGEKIKITLSRYHITGNKSHIGAWHRDGDMGTRRSLQISLFLYDEKGFELIESSHDREFSMEENTILNQKYGVHDNLPNSTHVEAKAGQMIVFNPAILHRGISEKARANIHFRFEVDEDYEVVEPFNKYGFNEQWNSVLSNKNTIITTPEVPEFSSNLSFKSLVRKFVKTFVHYVIFFLPLNSVVYGRTGAYPSLKLRRLFHIR